MRKEYDFSDARPNLYARRLERSIRRFDTVVLLRDLPEAGLRVGDLGAVVQLYAPDTFEVEFVTATGRTQALQTLTTADVRAIRDDDLLAVRQTAPLRDARP